MPSLNAFIESLTSEHDKEYIKKNICEIWGMLQLPFEVYKY